MSWEEGLKAGADGHAFVIVVEASLLRSVLVAFQVQIPGESMGTGPVSPFSWPLRLSLGISDNFKVPCSL